MKKVLIFDLYDTLLKDISFQFDAGLLYLYHRFFSSACTWKEMTDFFKTFLPLYEKRGADNTEVCLIRDEVSVCFERFGVTNPGVWEELDYQMMNQMQKVMLPNDVRDTLEAIQTRGIPMYVLSNSIFTGASTRKLLGEFNILRYFRNVYSSADYGIRKPSAEFFQLAIHDVLSDYPGIGKENILYVGNDYVTDVMGANSAGLDVVWYNIGHFPDEKGLAAFDVDDFRAILEIMRQ